MMTGYLHPIDLNGTTIPCNILLAPLAGFTDPPFRRIALDNGACFTYTEMVSAEGLVRGSVKTEKLLDRADNEELLGIQLFGSEPDRVGEAVKICLRYNPAILDLNCGCPVPKVIKTGAGSALMKDPDRIRKIVGAMKSALKREGSAVPVSVKIRSGWDAHSLNYREAAAAACEAGADMVALHGRTRSQGYSGKADWNHIRELKRSVDVPVVGSGDLYTPEDVASMLETTGCDGVMIARGAIGNPFIFRNVREYLSSGETQEQPDVHRKLNTAWEQFLLMMRYKGEKSAVKEIKKHFCAYTKGLQGGAELRKKLVHASSAEEFKNFINEFLEKSCSPPLSRGIMDT